MLSILYELVFRDGDADASGSSIMADSLLEPLIAADGSLDDPRSAHAVHTMVRARAP